MKHNVVPRSGSSITSAQTRTKPGTSGTNRCRARVSVPSCCLRASRSAAPQQNRRASRTPRAGAASGPRSIQRRAPYALTPMPGTSTATSDTTGDDQHRVGERPVGARWQPHREPEHRDAEDDELDLLDHLRPHRSGRRWLRRRRSSSRRPSACRSRANRRRRAAAAGPRHRDGRGNAGRLDPGAAIGAAGQGPER